MVEEERDQMSLAPAARPNGMHPTTNWRLIVNLALAALDVRRVMLWRYVRLPPL